MDPDTRNTELTNPLVSILTPTYNHGRFLASCLDSVLAQEYTHWELVVLDDGSIDDTVSIASAYANRDPRIRVFTRENRGPQQLASLYNMGLELTSGDWVAILEGDDIWPIGKLERQVTGAAPGIALSFGRCVIVDEEGVPIIAPRRQAPRKIMNNWPVGSAFAAFIKQTNFIPAVTAMVRRQNLLDIGGFIQGPGMMQVDFGTWCALGAKLPFQYFDEVLGFWRRHESSITSTRMAEMVTSKKKFLEGFMEEHPEISALLDREYAIEWRAALRDATSEFWIQWRTAQQKLQVRDFRSARLHYHKAFLNGAGFRRKGMALVGWFAAFVHINVFAMRHESPSRVPTPSRRAPARRGDGVTRFE
jgi:glycosyltransferase involved in cell wall biosynthesis